ncbi:ABC transporter [Lysobacter pythonis]|uniref:ABC transporter n=1 Tax=Solilutibacter pythonis TaxID=2483112 RepID=A0A3M2HWA9_9GAMM|nr:ABC-type transport auxiliary lipoprotein family protein [Lysobacter pythonis]RMH93328.1 ABC transporter [Lysobacter pythonis]
MNHIAPRTFALLLALAALAGCGIVPKKSEITLYSPRISAVPDPAWPRAGAQLVVMRPSADRLTDSNRIVVRPTPGEAQVYRGASWVQPAPDMLQDAVIHLLEDSGKLNGVARRGGGIAGDFNLALDIRRFDADYAGGDKPTAVVEVSASLIRNDRNQVAGHRVFRASTPAAGVEVADVSRAFEQALSQVAKEVSGWSLRAMDEAR